MGLACREDRIFSLFASKVGAMVEIKAWAHDPSAESLRATFRLLEAKLKHSIMEW